MHGGSSKKELTRIPIEGILDLANPLGIKVTLHVPNWKSWSEEHLVHQGEQMYEHIAYELRYENLGSIEHGSICMKAHYFI